MTSGTTNHATAPAAAGDLDRLGRLHGTSKSSDGRSLLRAYEPFLAPLRDAAFELLEIGVGDGASLRLWADYFPRATIVGLDVRRLALGGLPDRCTLRHGSQSDLATLHDLVRAHRFRVIIDDGSHVSADQIFTFAKGLQGDKRLFLVTDIQFTTDGEPGATITGFIFVVADPPAAAQ